MFFILSFFLFFFTCFAYSAMLSFSVCLALYPETFSDVMVSQCVFVVGKVSGTFCLPQYDILPCIYVLKLLFFSPYKRELHT